MLLIPVVLVVLFNISLSSFPIHRWLEVQFL